MNFQHIHIFKSERLALGQAQDSGNFYLAIPVFNGLAEYEEYYALSEEEFGQLQNQTDLRKDFVQKCRERKMDDRLIQKPGRIRGYPI